MRRRALRAGVKIFDHHPALELLGDDGSVAGAAGVDRQRNRPWRVRGSGAVVLGTGGCAFGERMLGAAALTGDGYLMAAEAGAAMSGMEFSAQYATSPKPRRAQQGDSRSAGPAFIARMAAGSKPKAGTGIPSLPRRSSKGRSSAGMTGPSRKCRNGCGRASRTASSCRSIVALSIHSPNSGR